MSEPVRVAALKHLAEQAVAAERRWWLWDDPVPLSGYAPNLAFANAASPPSVLALVAVAQAAQAYVNVDEHAAPAHWLASRYDALAQALARLDFTEDPA